MSSLLCVPILVESVETALRDAHEARRAGADLVEFRVDDFFTGAAPEDDHAGAAIDTPETRDVLRLAALSPLPCIITCRSAREGGGYDGPDDARVALYERLGTAFGKFPDGSAEHPPRYLDAELSTWERSANIRQKLRLAIDHPEQLRDLRTSLVLSMHDFDGRPVDLARRLAAMRAIDAARVLKIAYRCRSIRDNLEFFDILAERDRPTVALGMGEFGLMSRVLAPKFGGFLTFASLRSETVTAPGQPTIRELLDLYRFRSITPTTEVYGVIGYPLGHSLSPRVHNAGFAAIERDAVYLPMPVVGGDGAGGDRGGAAAEATRAISDGGYESLKATLTELIEHPRLAFRGASVTIPHKENLVRLARESGWRIDADADAIGAANTILVERGTGGAAAGISVHNTDAQAIVASLEVAIGSLAGARITVLGAGGTARAAAFALARAGSSVTIHARRPERAKALAESLSRALESNLDSRSPTIRASESATVGDYDALINCTPVGMEGGPAPDSTPIPAASLRPGAVVLDTVYRPVETPLIRAARDRNSRLIDGLTMFVLQAEAQFRLFTGVPSPSRLFERVVRESSAG
ncbi:MAG: type I 3-dehydroquinate dehydratase [Phycisphaerales bacterium]